MSRRPEVSWSLWCDFPDCDRKFEYGDYSIFGGDWDAETVVEDVGGWLGRCGDRHYCNNHPAAWASALAEDDPEPEPPYLLIHDGDTDDFNDDGKVTVIVGISELTP